MEFDLRDVRVLQEDRKVLAERLGVLVQRGVMKRSEARAELGLPVTRGDDVYLVPRALAETRPTSLRGKLDLSSRTNAPNPSVGTVVD